MSPSLRGEIEPTIYWWKWTDDVSRQDPSSERPKTSCVYFLPQVLLDSLSFSSSFILTYVFDICSLLCLHDLLILNAGPATKPRISCSWTNILPASGSLHSWLYAGCWANLMMKSVYDSLYRKVPWLLSDINLIWNCSPVQWHNQPINYWLLYYSSLIILTVSSNDGHQGGYLIR